MHCRHIIIIHGKELEANRISPCFSYTLLHIPKYDELRIPNYSNTRAQSSSARLSKGSQETIPSATGSGQAPTRGRACPQERCSAAAASAYSLPSTGEGAAAAAGERVRVARSPPPTTCRHANARTEA
eukprot:GHVU01178011.1.p1 GENE.GHVU01178011.1~~GHVU01178011.1.p1  ORF type:complete len:128 (+),score=5.14 GHVU01178011.1:618-1001(+)